MLICGAAASSNLMLCLQLASTTFISMPWLAFTSWHFLLWMLLQEWWLSQPHLSFLQYTPSVGLPPLIENTICCSHLLYRRHFPWVVDMGNLPGRSNFMQIVLGIGWEKSQELDWNIGLEVVLVSFLYVYSSDTSACLLSRQVNNSVWVEWEKCVNGYDTQATL